MILCVNKNVMNCKSMSNVLYSSSIVIIEKRAKVEEMKKNITFCVKSLVL